MSRCKRSERLTVAAIHGALLAVAVGCSGTDQGAPDFGGWDPIAVLETEQDQRAGVRGFPLEPGESLGFDFGEPVRMRWTMVDVDYPLLLVGIDGDGRAAEVSRMEPGECCYMLDGEYRTYVEVRP